MENKEIIEKIKKSGIKQKILAQKLGITENSFSNKMKNKSNFTESEKYFLLQILK